MATYPLTRPLEDPPAVGTRHDRRSYYKLGFYLTRAELQQRLPAMKEKDEGRDLWVPVRHYKARWQEWTEMSNKEYAWLVYDIYLSQQSGEALGVGFFFASNERQSSIDLAKDPEILEHVRDIFRFPTDMEFVWYRVKGAKGPQPE